MKPNEPTGGKLWNQTCTCMDYRIESLREPDCPIHGKQPETTLTVYPSSTGVQANTEPVGSKHNSTPSGTPASTELYEKVEKLFDLRINNTGNEIHIGFGAKGVWVDYEAFLKLRKSIEDLVDQTATATAQAYGGCKLCYGKGYATVNDRWHGYDTDTDIGSPGGYLSGGDSNAMKFCTCDRGKQLAKQVEKTATARCTEARIDELDEISELFYQAYLEDEDVHNELNQRIIGKRLATLKAQAKKKKEQ